MKVYVVLEGNIAESMVDRIFSSENRARQWVKRHPSVWRNPRTIYVANVNSSESEVDWEAIFSEPER